MLNNMKILTSTISLAISTMGVSANAGSWSPGTYQDYVMPYSEETYVEVFEAGYLATIILDGDCYSDIDLWVYDDEGYLVAKSTSNGCYEYVDFYPSWTGEFMIVVENRGKPNGSSFYLETY